MQKEDRATSSYRDLITPPLASCGKIKGAQTAAFVLLALTREKSAQNFSGAVYRRTNVIGERGSANDIEGWFGRRRFGAGKANATWKRKKTSIQGLRAGAQTPNRQTANNVTRSALWK